MAGTVLRNSVAGVAAQLAIKILSFGFSVLVVRQLGADQFGQYAAVLAFGAVFVFLADLGLGVYLVREVSHARTLADAPARIGQLFGDGLALRTALAVMAAILLIATAILTGRSTPMVVAIAMGTLGLLAFSVQGTCESVLAGFERLDIPALAKVANQVAFVTLGTLALVVGAGYHGLVVATILGATLMAIICWRGVRRLGVNVSAPSPHQWPALLRASAPFAVIAGTLGLSYKFDSVLLNLLRGDAETGYYSAAYSLVFAAAFLSNALNTALFPTMTRQAASSPASLVPMYEQALRYLMLIALPIAFGGWALADQLVVLLFGPAFEIAGTALAILIWTVPLMFVSELLGYIVVVRGEEKRVARAVLLSTGVNIAGNVMVVPLFGFTGAAIMTVVTEAVLVGQYVWHLRAVLAEVRWGTAVGLPLVAALGMAGLALALHALPPALTMLCAGLTYGVLLLVLRVIGPDEVRSVRALLARAPTAHAQA
jgi:O-antigen/teichoic acid export membrane protein